MAASDPNAGRTLYRSGGKRLLDTILILAAAPALLPIVALTAVTVRFALGSPVLFTQTRPGLDGRPFRILKFRTMTLARDDTGELQPDRDRLTPFGSWLRRTSMDELPELWNVLTGSMSLVGPRPLLTRYLERYSPRESRRHEVRPGITGWAQVNGRNAIDWHKKLDLDVWYVDNLTLFLDLKILARTLLITLTGRGVTSDGEATTTEFLGDEGDRQ